MTSEDPDPAPPPSEALPSGRAGATPITDDPPAADGGAADARPSQPTDDGTLVTQVDAGTEPADLGVDGD